MTDEKSTTDAEREVEHIIRTAKSLGVEVDHSEESIEDEPENESEGET